MTGLFDKKVAWEELHEIKGFTYQQVIAWLEAHGIDISCWDYDDYDDEAYLYISDDYVDETPMIEFEDGVVVRWYRSR